MPIMSAQGQKDARGAARLLALTARDCVRDPSIAGQSAVVLNNAYRLLQAFRSNAFFGLEPHVHRFPYRATETISLLPRSEHHLKDVRKALDAALTATFPSQKKDEAIAFVEDVLRKITFPDKFGPATDTDLQRACHFFDVLLQQLKTE